MERIVRIRDSLDMILFITMTPRITDKSIVLFQDLVQTNTTEIFNAPYYWQLWRESESPHTAGQ